MRVNHHCATVVVLLVIAMGGTLKAAHFALVAAPPLDAGHGVHDETFVDGPLAMPGTTVVIQGTCQADLAGSTHYLEIGLGGTTWTWTVVATWFQFDGDTDCIPPYTFDYDETTIPAEQWNGYVTGGAPGEVYLRAEYSPAVEKYCLACPDCNCVGEPECDNPQTHVTIAYDDVRCVGDLDCDDGLFCNGAETCVDYECQPGPGDPCAPLGLFCDEDADQCRSDCNSNGVYDDLDIHGSTSHDCNDNDLPDECDLVAMTSGDCNTNSVPDECDVANLGGGFDDSSFWAAYDPGANGVGADPVVLDYRSLGDLRPPCRRWALCPEGADCYDPPYGVELSTHNVRCVRDLGACMTRYIHGGICDEGAHTDERARIAIRQYRNAKC